MPEYISNGVRQNVQIKRQRFVHSENIGIHVYY